MTKMKIKFYSDPGHGWAAVKMKTLVDLGIANKITPYSYMRGKTAYLEEDCDLSTFVNACKAQGITPTFIDKHTDASHPIRSYAVYDSNDPVFQTLTTKAT